MRKRVLPLPALVAAAVAVAGCGSDPAVKTVDTNQIRSVVTQFAQASGPRACALLSPDAVVNVYGSFTQPVDQARAACIAKSSSFKGKPVTITDVNVIDASTAKVGATNPKGDVTYSITMRRFGPSWRIDAINQRKTPQ